MTRTVLIISALLLLTACTSSKSAPKHTTSSGALVQVSGTLTLTGGLTDRQSDPIGSACYTPGNSPALPVVSVWDDVKQGAQVVVTDAGGLTVGVGQLDGGTTTTAVTGGTGHPDCEFTFSVADVKGGSAFYKVTVGAHSKQIPGSGLAAAQIVFP